jgi:hypothetical protein
VILTNDCLALSDPPCPSDTIIPSPVSIAIAAILISCDLRLLVAKVRRELT